MTKTRLASVAVLALMLSGPRQLIGERFQPSRADPVTAWFLGTSSIVFGDGKTFVISDGFVSRPGPAEVLRPIEPNKARVEEALTRLKLTSVAAVFVGHSHYDHAMDAPLIAQRTGALLIGSGSTANVGRGQHLDENHIRVVNQGEALRFGDFELLFIESRHSLGEPSYSGPIDRPLQTPARVSEWRADTTWSVLVRHGERTALVHGSANYVPGALRGRHADVVYLGIGRMAKRSKAFVDGYWNEVVRATGARRVVLVHWDDFFRDLSEPLRPLPADGFERSKERILCRARADHVDVKVPVAWAATDPFADLPASAPPLPANCP